MMTIDGPLGALSWEPNIKGGLYVLIAVAVLCGSAQLLLSTNVGSRLGFQLAAAGLFGFFVLIGSVWWVYGIGPKGRAPTWKPQTTVTGDPAQLSAGSLAGFPEGWRELDLADKKVADAQPVVDGVLVPEDGDGLFGESSDYEVVAAYGKGGEAYGPLGLDFRPLNLFHKPTYLTIRVQATTAAEPAEGGEAEPVEGTAPAKPEVDPAAQPVSVVLLRDLGSLRLNTGIATVASALIFGLFVYQLHTRDKEAMAKAAAGRSVTSA